MTGLFPRADNYFRSEGLEVRRFRFHETQGVGEQFVRFHFDVVWTVFYIVGIDVGFHIGQGEFGQFLSEVAEGISISFPVFFIDGSHLYQSVAVFKT